MKNITLDGTAVLQFDVDGTDGALDAAADRDALRNDAAFDLCAIADHKIRSAQLAFEFGRRHALDHRIQFCRQPTCRSRYTSPVPISPAPASA